MVLGQGDMQCLRHLDRRIAPDPGVGHCQGKRDTVRRKKQVRFVPAQLLIQGQGESVIPLHQFDHIRQQGFRAGVFEAIELFPQPGLR